MSTVTEWDTGSISVSSPGQMDMFTDARFAMGSIDMMNVCSADQARTFTGLSRRGVGVLGSSLSTFTPSSCGRHMDAQTLTFRGRLISACVLRPVNDPMGLTLMRFGTRSTRQTIFCSSRLILQLGHRIT